MHENAIKPTRGSKYAAGWDLYAVDDYRIFPFETCMIDTGVAMEIPIGCFGGLHARSGLSTKRKLLLANGVGVLDADFRGSIKVPLYNASTETQWIRKGERVAQVIIIPFADKIDDFQITDELSETDRGSGGFGSTGE
jgi:dUTP pyrophosphatase